jgi:hypothetical protein
MTSRAALSVLAHATGMADARAHTRAAKAKKQPLI